MLQTQWPTDANVLRDSNHLNTSPSANNGFAENLLRNLGPCRPGQYKEDPSADAQKDHEGLRLLHSSPNAEADLIFVHGLRGGSDKTWRSSRSPSFFWPTDGLLQEPEFPLVNIHTFGYDADWVGTKSKNLGVTDFGRTLLEEMRNSSTLRSRGLDDDDIRPIILIGHSMGGLVIKKACVMAKDDEELNDRIGAVFFLGTPHQGSGLAAILDKVLTVTGIRSPQEYIKELMIGSTSSYDLQEDFREYARDLPIHSFFEAVPISSSLGSAPRLIVEKNSAVLGSGFPHERERYLNADHRNLVRFAGSDDDNYVIVKNALSAAIHGLLQGASVERRRQAKFIKKFLGIENMYVKSHDRVDGSCEWFKDCDEFQSWLHPTHDASLQDPGDTGRQPALFWMQGNPGTGKTVLASYVVAHLQALDKRCARYYFHAGSKSSQSLGDVLRSIAYQMASSNPAVLDKLLKLKNEGFILDQDDVRTIWAKVFQQEIFQAQTRAPQYWVIDAVDECDKYHELFAMFQEAKARFPLQILITSRKIPSMQTYAEMLDFASISLTSFEVPKDRTLDDIALYIESRIPYTKADINKDELSSYLLHHSNGSFLWVYLVLEDLRDLYTRDGAFHALENIPTGMIPFYERTVTRMTESDKELGITRTILTWVVGSYGDMTVEELSDAVSLDLDRQARQISQIPSSSELSAEMAALAVPSVHHMGHNPREVIEGRCGQLLSIDRRSGVVSVMHPTVREFLLSDGAGSLRISTEQAHKAIAITCLELLSGDGMKPASSIDYVEDAGQEKSSHLLTYATMHFSEHVASASCDEDELLLLAISRFLGANVLSWIERVAATGDLRPLSRAAEHLTTFLGKRAELLVPLNDNAERVSAWAEDLNQLLPMFGPQLLQSPSSIHHLIPSQCPTESIIYRQFGQAPEGTVAGVSQGRHWGDLDPAG